MVNTALNSGQRAIDPQARIVAYQGRTSRGYRNMDLRPITDGFAVAPQILPEDGIAIRDAGYHSIICNRPDGEEYGQCSHSEIETAAREIGLEFKMLPIQPGIVTENAAAEFQDALQTLPGPILAYCRSGTRCTMLWSIVKFGELPPEVILQKTAEAGYDMSGLVAQLQEMQNQ